MLTKETCRKIASEINGVFYRKDNFGSLTFTIAEVIKRHSKKITQSEFDWIILFLVGEEVGQRSVYTAGGGGTFYAADESIDVRVLEDGPARLEGLT